MASIPRQNVPPPRKELSQRMKVNVIRKLFSYVVKKNSDFLISE